jgi:hypothetical protein
MAERAGFEPALPFELYAAFRFARLIEIRRPNENRETTKKTRASVHPETPDLR